MKAARLHTPGSPLQIDEIPTPTIGENDVLVEVKYAGLNGGDIHFIDEQYELSQKVDTHSRHFPITISHEGAGIVAEVGKNPRKDLKVGDRVAIHPHISCGFCYFCRTDNETVCENKAVIGFVNPWQPKTTFGKWAAEYYKDGTAANYIRMPSQNVYKIPDNLPFDQAAKLDILGTAYRACKFAKVRPGDTVVVNAATGGSGVPALMLAELFGASKIIAVARNKDRIGRIAKLLGSDIIEGIGSDENITQRIMEITRGRGADSLIDYIPRGGGKSFVQSAYGVRQVGRIVLVGSPGAEEVSISYRWIMVRGVEIVGTRAHSGYEYDELLNLCDRNTIDLSKLVTHRFSLDKINDALRVMKSREGDPIWVVCSP